MKPLKVMSIGQIQFRVFLFTLLFLSIENSKKDLVELDCQNYISTSEIPRSSDSNEKATFDILVITPPAPSYFAIDHQIPPLCYAWASIQSAKPDMASKFDLNFFNYEIDSSDPVNFNYFGKLFKNGNYNFIGILGPDLDFLSNVLIQENTDSGLSFLSYSQKSDTLQDNVINNGNIFRVTVPFSYLNTVYDTIFDIYNWQRGAIMYESSSPYLRDAFNALYNRFSAEGTDIYQSEIQPYSTTEELQQTTNAIGPEGLDHRILILFLEDEAAAKAACALYSTGMSGANYVVFGLTFWNLELWESYGTNCSMEEFMLVLDYSFYISQSGYSWNLTSIIEPINITRQRYLDDMTRLMRHENITSKWPHIYASGLVSDALWSLLSATQAAYNQLDLQDYHRNRSTFLAQISSELKLLSFEGASGTVSFGSKDNRTSSGTYAIVYENIDSYLQETAKLKLPGDMIENDIKFLDDVIPNTDRELTTTNLRLLDLCVIVPALAGILFCLVSSTIYLIFHDKPAIKLLSPKINAMCGFGSVIAFTTISGHMIYNMNRKITIEGDKTSESSWGCVVYDVLLQTGFFVSFGCLVAKLYRVHRIFANIRVHKKVPSDLRLLTIVFLATLVQIGFNLIANYFSPPIRAIIEVALSDHDPNGINGNDLFLVCQKPSGSIKFLGYCLDGILILLAIYFSWTTRRVKVSLINESHKVGSMVITVLVLEALKILSNLSFQTDSASMGNYFTQTEVTIFVHWVIIGQVFFPGLVRLIRKPNWKPITTILPLNLNNKAEIRRCMEDVGNIHGLQHLLNLHVRTCEMWAEMKAKDEVSQYLNGSFRRRSNSTSNLLDERSLTRTTERINRGGTVD